MESVQQTLPSLGPAPLVPGPVFRKATDEQIVESYKETRSLKRTASKFGMCPQSVHERLVRLGENRHTNLFTEQDCERLRASYDWYASDGRLQELADEMGRTRHFLARQARKLGLTRRSRECPYLAYSTHAQKIEWHKNNPHPRGMLGKTHSEKFRDEQSERSFVRWHSMGKDDQVAFSKNSRRGWKAGWREVGGKRIWFRSRWEANYGRYLEWLKGMGNITDWEHEPKVFWFLEIKRGTRSYLPDFRITENDGSQPYHEVKGWMDPQSKTKIKRMAKYYPDIKLIIVGRKGYLALEKLVGRMIVGWEFSG